MVLAAKAIASGSKVGGWRYCGDGEKPRRQFPQRLGESAVKKSKFILALQPSLMEEARKLAKAQGLALNRFISMAVAEKVSALGTDAYFAERAARGDIKKALQLLKLTGARTKSVLGDRLSVKRTARATR